MLRNLALDFSQEIYRWVDSRWDNPAACGRSNEPWEIYHLEERGEIFGRVRGQNAGAAIGRFCRCKVGRSKHTTKRRGVEGQDGGVDTEERAPT